MINAKKSVFKKTGINYEKDSILDIIDIGEALISNKVITKCKEEDFIYYNDLFKPLESNKLPPLDEYYFELDNGHQKPFTDYYKPIDLIGQGCFSTVISAMDLQNKNCPVAIKIIPKYKFKNIHEFLKREVNLHSELNHNNIIKLLYVRENINFIFLVMELMEGGTLKDLMIERYRETSDFFTEDECATIIKNILQGIKYLHSLKILHRDIKPDNIMLKSKGDLNSIKLGDFGFSTDEQVYDEKECGTLIYMPPESQQNNEFADIWAAGFILYILISGGEHPIFRKKMTYNEYNDCFRERSKDWKLKKDLPM